MNSLLVWLSTIPIIGTILEFIKKQIIRSIRTGKLPNHIAFIMDGNRRYAREHRLPVSEGHNMGSESLVSILELCYHLNISAVSVYAFSIENFKRSKKEVDFLMDLIKEKIAQMLENGEMVDKFGIKIIFSGNRKYLPNDVLHAFEIAETQTAQNKNVVLNFCLPYTARDDITHSVRCIASQVKKHSLNLDQINQNTVTKNLYTGSLPPLDFLVRTSGVRRLSDYMLWEVTDNNAEVELLNILWPDLNQLILCWSLFKWSFRKSSLNDFFSKSHQPLKED